MEEGKISGHDTRDVLQKYIYFHDAEIVDEYKGIVVEFNCERHYPSKNLKR